MNLFLQDLFTIQPAFKFLFYFIYLVFETTIEKLYFINQFLLVKLKILALLINEKYIHKFIIM